MSHLYIIYIILLDFEVLIIFQKQFQYFRSNIQISFLTFGLIHYLIYNNIYFINHLRFLFSNLSTQKPIVAIGYIDILANSFLFIPYIVSIHPQK